VSQGDFRCYYESLFCFCCSAQAAVIKDIPDGERAIVGTVVLITVVVYLLGGLR
jgi:hypothetical protein